MSEETKAPATTGAEYIVTDDRGKNLPARPSMSFGLAEMEKLAETVAKSQMFGMKTKEQALTLMFVAQSENRHPMSVVMDYHLIHGEPSLKAEVMLSRFQAAGGKVDWKQYDDTAAEASFSHPAGGKITVRWDMARAKQAGLSGKDNWQHYPAAMLRSRCISEGIRTVYPGATGGFYTPEEVQDIPPDELDNAQPSAIPSNRKNGNVTKAKTPAEQPPAEPEKKPDPEPQGNVQNDAGATSEPTPPSSSTAEAPVDAAPVDPAAQPGNGESAEPEKPKLDSFQTGFAKQVKAAFDEAKVPGEKRPELMQTAVYSKYPTRTDLDWRKLTHSELSATLQALKRIVANYKAA